MEATAVSGIALAGAPLQQIQRFTAMEYGTVQTGILESVILSSARAGRLSPERLMNTARGSGTALSGMEMCAGNGAALHGQQELQTKTFIAAMAGTALPGMGIIATSGAV